MSRPLIELVRTRGLAKKCESGHLFGSAVWSVNMSYRSTEAQPAFFHSYEYSRGHKLGVIKLNPAVAARIAQDSLRETLHPRHLPMLVKPKPWLSDEDGGYLNNKSLFRFDRLIRLSMAYVSPSERHAIQRLSGAEGLFKTRFRGW